MSVAMPPYASRPPARLVVVVEVGQPPLVTGTAHAHAPGAAPWPARSWARSESPARRRYGMVSER